jgi:hypothetical protein
MQRRARNAWHRIAKQVAGGRGRDVWLLYGDPKEQLELGTNGSEIRRGSKGKVELQKTWKQKHAVDRTAAGQIKEANSVELCDEPSSPIFQDLGDGRAIANGKSEVKVGPAVARTMGERPNGRTGHDALVGFGPFNHTA